MDTVNPDKTHTEDTVAYPQNESDTTPVFNKDETLVRKPSTQDVLKQIALKPTFRYGDLIVGPRALLMLSFLTVDKPPVYIEVQNRFVLGRSQSSSRRAGPDLCLQRYGGFNLGVSRYHAAIQKKVDILQVVDLGSTNGTYLNGMRLQPHQARILRNGDQLHLGLLHISVFFLPEDYASATEIFYESGADHRLD